MLHATKSPLILKLIPRLQMHELKTKSAATSYWIETLLRLNLAMQTFNVCAVFSLKNDMTLLANFIHLNLLNEPVTTPVISKCMDSTIRIGVYLPEAFAGKSLGRLFFCLARILMVNSPSIIASTISPTTG